MKKSFICVTCCYSQRYEESFFSLERLPNTHDGDKLMKKTYKIMNLTTFILKGYKIEETKITAKSASDLLPKHQTSEISLKTSEVATLMHIIHVQSSHKCNSKNP